AKKLRFKMGPQDHRHRSGSARRGIPATVESPPPCCLVACSKDVSMHEIGRTGHEDILGRGHLIHPVYARGDPLIFFLRHALQPSQSTTGSIIHDTGHTLPW